MPINNLINVLADNSQFGFGNPVTGVGQLNVSNRTLSLSGPHPATLTTQESYIHTYNTIIRRIAA